MSSTVSTAEASTTSPVGAPARARVSACLLTYNHAHALPDVLDSLLQQSHGNYEVVVSDDCSSDGSWELIRGYAERDSRIRAIRTPQNMGMARNANFAVQHATGEYVALLHHDDRYRPELLDRWSALLERDPTIAFVFNSYLSGGQLLSDPSLSGGRIDGRWFLRHRLLWKWGCPVRGTAMIRRSSWEKVDGMRSEFGLLADVDLWMRLARHWAVGYVEEPLIEVGHTWPADYPAEYTDFSWRRLRIGYELHAVNVRDFYRESQLRRALACAAMRCLISWDIAKWLVYARFRRPDVLARAEESRTPHELWPLGWLRRAVGAGRSVPAREEG